MTALLVFLLTLVTPYGSFRHVKPDAGVTMVEALAQDGDGLIWFGTNRGLYCHDGYTTHAVPGAGRTYSIVSDPDARRLYIGTEDGLALLDGGTGICRTLEGGPGGIRSVLADADSLWLGSFEGLYSWRDGRFTPHPGLRTDIIYSLLDAGNTLYIGTYDGLTAFCKDTETFTDIPLPNPGGRVNIFVNALARWQDTILVGTEDGLFRYDPRSGAVQEIPVSRNSVKTFGTDAQGQVLVGTDNGLYILGPDGIRHVRHEAGREDSLGNDIVWSILRDREDRIWLGTDESVSAVLPPVPVTGIADMTGSREGNRFTSILKDSRGRLWLGGTDGLLSRTGDKTRWYRVDDPALSLAHNRIRRVYEDRDGDIWLCTDGSLHILEGNRFRRLDLSDSTGTRNANWAYDMVHDSRGRIWVATSLGGVLIKDKAALLAGQQRADSTITLPGGSHGLYAYQLAQDRDGHIWCLFYNDGLWRFSPDGSSEFLSRGSVPSCLYGDPAGRVWVAEPGVIRQGDHSYHLPFPGDVLCMGVVDGALWVSTADGMFALDPVTGRIGRIRTAEHTVSAIFGDGPDAILGTRDAILQGPAASLRVPERPRTVLLTAVTIGNTVYYTLDGKAVKDCDNLVLGPGTTHLSFSFSDLPYDEPDQSRLLWRLAGIDTTWNPLPSGQNQVMFNQLKYGRYALEVASPDAAGQPAGVRTVHFRIRRPWYLRGWAFLLYLLAGAGLVFWVIRFERLSRRLQLEKIEKNAILDNLVQASLQMGPADLVELARRCFDDFKAGLDGREAVFTTNVSACTISIDEYRIATALENVLTNAAEHGRGRIEMALHLHDGQITVSVSDEGPGIPKQDLPHVKERFYRGQGARRHGAGVGLYLADVYVTRSGGTLELVSEGGTCVRMTFPVVKQVPAQAQPSADERFLSEITELIENHLDDNMFNVSALSERTGLGGKLVYRKVKQLTGLTPVEYLRTLRLRKAAALLRENRYTVSEVMYRVGFTNASYFSKCFQAEFGTTPRHYAEGER